MTFNPRIPNAYGYHPSLAPGIIFVIVFTISASIHLYQSLRQTIHNRRLWWLWLFFIGASLECLGWIARTVTNPCPYSLTLFKMQLSVLISAPAFTQAGLYVILWAYVQVLGRHTSPVPPKLYLITILCLDVICLSLQAIGGGLAGAAFSKRTDTQPGTTTMVVGIVTQLVSTCVFAVLLSVVFFRGWSAIRAERLMLLAAATLLSVACMIIRGVYRSIELLQGWRGELITDEKYVVALEGSMMFVAVAVFNAFSPGVLLAGTRVCTAVAGGGMMEESEISEVAPIRKSPEAISG
ncbi:hypothetical protein H2201_003580 [Coniosporium apollinis]|uniref:RTA1 domain protein n=1 Tax=Coniosporium apollinis TaxID=61459 RepID=A0ABQ9NVH5_9PEZI|nr:hypothetical protein H2201_003580 [Coniosporium apollinis]